MCGVDLDYVEPCRGGTSSRGAKVVDHSPNTFIVKFQGSVEPFVRDGRGTYCQPTASGGSDCSASFEEGTPRRGLPARVGELRADCGSAVAKPAR